MRQQIGMSLLEVLITISIFSLATLIVAAYVIQSYQTNRFAMRQADAIEHARRGIAVMTKEIREATFSDIGSFPIAAASSQTLTLYSNIDTDSAVERVRYFLDGTDFKKGVIKPTGIPPSYPAGNETIVTLSPYVRNGVDPVFYYYNGDYPSTTDPLLTPANPNEVKLIEIKIRVTFDPTTIPKEYTLKNYVQIRNLKDNL